MNSDPSNNLVQRRFNDRSTSDEYYERFNRNQYYNAVEDEQIYMDEYTTLLHHYNDFIVTGNAMFSRMEQTLRENIARSHVRQSFYYHRYNDLIRARTQLPLMQPPVPLNTIPPSPAIPRSPAAAAAPAPAPQREEPIRPRDNTSPQPQLPSANRLGEVFPRLLSRYFTSELNRESREINNNRENLFSMLYTVPVAIRTTGAVGGGGGGGAAATGAPTNDQINRATLNTLFSHIVSPVNATCPISRDEFNDDSEITMIRGCNHIFNRASLREWFVSHSTCPMCRSDIREYQAPREQQPSQSHQHNISIDRIDDNELTFSYDIPLQYNNDDIYRDIVNTITGMAQTAHQNRNNNNHNHNHNHNHDDDDIMEVD